jgi:hypothetical protein
MKTLIVNKATTKDINLLIDIAKKIGIVLEVAPKTGLNAPVVAEKKISKAKQIMQLSKEVNRNMTRKLLEKHL